MRMEGQLSCRFALGVGVRLGCVMPPWLFNILTDGFKWEMKAKVGTIGARLRLSKVGWSVVGCLLADGTII